MCTAMCKYNFCEAPYLWDSFAQEKHNFTSPALVIANHSFNNHISTLSHVSVPGPQWYQKCFKKNVAGQQWNPSVKKISFVPFSSPSF